MSWVILELIVVKCAVLGVCLAMLDISKWSLDQHLFITWIWSLNSQGVVWPFFGIWAPVGPYFYPTPHVTNLNAPTQSLINNSPPCHGFFCHGRGVFCVIMYIYISLCFGCGSPILFWKFSRKNFRIRVREWYHRVHKGSFYRLKGGTKKNLFLAIFDWTPYYNNQHTVDAFKGASLALRFTGYPGVT